MLTIRPEQMKAFRDQQTEDFRVRLQQHLLNLPVVQAMEWSPQRIRTETEEAIRYGQEFHLTREADVARLAEIFCTRLQGFAGKLVEPDGLNILYSYGVEPETKLRSFEEYLDSNSYARQGERDLVLG